MPIQIGATGRTISPLHPSGRVEIDGRCHDARTEGLPLEADTPVVVIGGDRFSLLVRPLQPGEEPRLEQRGLPVRSFDEEMKSRVERDRVEQALTARERRRQEMILAGVGALVGFLVWLGALYESDQRDGWPVALAIAVLGGAAVGPALHSAHLLLGGEYFPLMAGGGIAGAIVGAMAGMALFGLVGAMATAVVGAIVMPVVLLFFVALPQFM